MILSYVSPVISAVHILRKQSSCKNTAMIPLIHCILWYHIRSYNIISYLATLCIRCASPIKHRWRCWMPARWSTSLGGASIFYMLCQQMLMLRQLRWCLDTSTLGLFEMQNGNTLWSNHWNEKPLSESFIFEKWGPLSFLKYLKDKHTQDHIGQVSLAKCKRSRSRRKTLNESVTFHLLSTTDKGKSTALYHNTTEMISTANEFSSMHHSWHHSWHHSQVVVLSIGLFNPNMDLLEVRTETYRQGQGMVA